MQIDKNNWQIKIDEENREEVVDYFILKYTGKDYMREIGRVNFGGEFLSIHDYQIPFLTHYQDSNIPLITTDQFRKYILGKEDRKIIGYKAPFDLFEEQVKSGDMYMKSGLFYHEENNKGFPLPKEIVEKYFYPVYEEEEKVIELHGYRISKDKITICDGNINIEIEDFKYLTNIRNEVLKAYEELNK